MTSSMATARPILIFHDDPYPLLHAHHSKFCIQHTLTAMNNKGVDVAGTVFKASAVAPMARRYLEAPPSKCFGIPNTNSPSLVILNVGC